MRVIHFALSISASAVLTASAAAGGTQFVQVTIENLSPDNGTFLTPFFTGFHDGSYDLFDLGSAASSSLERLAEDGAANFQLDDFNASGAGSAGGIIAPGGPFAPGATASMTFSVDVASRYFSFASMVIPSNDAFIGNSDQMAHEIFDAGGNFIGADFIISGSDVYDAGTEVNDELAANTAFFGQMMPDTGVDENGVITAHPGFLGSSTNPGTPSILADPMFENADFTVSGYNIARITITAVPGPGGIAILGLLGISARRRRQR